ncbi:MAG: threonine synthase [Spirochaetes bacterium]|nr:threonine synthase [Spirochaetota bacterium]
MRFAGKTSSPVGFREALFAGLAPDGSLYRPVEKPDLSQLFASFDARTRFVDLASRTSAALLAPEIDASVARRIAERAFPFSPVLRRLDERRQLLELFHGPTCAFKDFGAQFLAASMEAFVETEDGRIQVLVATSGDTGSAVAHAFHDRTAIDVIILYPSGRVSELQEKQLTTLGGNVHALEVDGSFDDCQRLAKAAFQDPGLARRLRLTSANSINIGRLLPQAFSYAWAAAQVQQTAASGGRRGAVKPARAGAAHAEAVNAGRGPVFCVPCGNFGHLTAGVYAWRWGLPVARFIAATNANDEVPLYLENGRFVPRASLATLSNAMDVGNPSNFERLLDVFDGDAKAMATAIHGCSVSDSDTRAGMRETWERHGVLVDPHTAVGCVAAERFIATGACPDGEVIVLSTAHPGKFTETVRAATGQAPELPERLARCLQLPKQAARIGTDLGGLRGLLLERFG